jgi:hypothetical protein
MSPIQVVADTAAILVYRIRRIGVSRITDCFFCTNSIIVDQPVKHVSQERGIVDLMLSRAQKKHRADDIEHLVVELKAPKVVLTATELSQLEGYAASVAEDKISNSTWIMLAFLVDIR